MRSTARKELAIEEVAHELTVSVATVSNWIKLGKIKKVEKVDRNLVFDKDEIMQIKNDITIGNSDKLKRRRNKKMVSGNIIPSEYVSYEPYVKIMNQVIKHSNHIENSNVVSIILLELVLKFLHSRKKIVINVVEERSLTELYSRNLLEIPLSIQSVLNELREQEDKAIPEEILTVLSEINQLDIPYIQGEDFLGLAYMSLSAAKSRKNSGSYYTPSKVVDLIMSQNAHIVKNKQKIKIVDPCCGSGNFLIKAFILLKEELLARGYTVEEAEKEIIEVGLHGYDINKTAVTLSALNLILLMDSEQHNIIPNVQCKDTLLEMSPTISSKHKGFDWVLGNPPWGYSYTNQEKLDLKKVYSITGNAIESFTLFIECGNHLLKESGILTYVLPESFLNIKVHSKIREDILRSTSIDSICILDRAFSNVFTKTITLTYTKKKCKNGHKLKIIDSKNMIEIVQDRFVRNEHYIFNINSDEKSFAIVYAIKNCRNVFYLKDKVNAEYALGIVTGDNKGNITCEKNDSNEVVVTGKNVYKYNMYPEDNYIVFKPKAFQQVAPERLYRASEKLIYRFINKYLVFSYDNKQTLSLNSANILIPKYEGYTVKYVLAILNSRVAQFFHTFSFSALKVLKKHIESIPIPLCTIEDQNRVIYLVDKILITEDSVVREEIFEQLDKIIMILYGLDEETQDYLIKTVDDVNFLSNNNMN